MRLSSAAFAFAASGVDRCARGRGWTAQVESLDLVCTKFLDSPKLRLAFDTFHNHLHAKFLRKQDERAHHCLCLRPLHDLFDKGTVDFESVEWQFLDVTKSRVAGTEVVDCNGYTEALQTLDCCDCVLQPTEHDRLCKFKLQECGSSPVFLRIDLTSSTNESRLNCTVETFTATSMGALDFDCHDTQSAQARSKT